MGFLLSTVMSQLSIHRSIFYHLPYAGLWEPLPAELIYRDREPCTLTFTLTGRVILVITCGWPGRTQRKPTHFESVRTQW